MAYIPDLNRHDRPSGTIVSGAYSVGWLNTILNQFYAVFPWAATVTQLLGAFVAHSDAYALPANFILDVKNGLLVKVNDRFQRVFRKPLQDAIDMGYNQNEGIPRIYTFQGDFLRIAPIPDQSYVGHLWYYKRPDALTANQVPVFPSDLILVEYIRIRALEWIRAAPIGSSQQYTEGRIAELIKAGLGNEPEQAAIPLAGDTFLPGAGSQSLEGSWLVRWNG